MIDLAAIEAAARNVYAAMLPTPQYAWPLLARRASREVWVKHENHTPTGAFKVRGGLNLLAQIAAGGHRPTGIVSATRGNHGQSLAYAARRHGMRCVIYVPRGNSADKNDAMRAFGAELVEHGRDFDEARVEAATVAEREGLRFIGPFERELVAGVATYALELFRATSGPSLPPGSPKEGDVPLGGTARSAREPLSTVYVPIGCGSGICGLISARNALGLSTEIVGVVSTHANAYAQSFAAGRAIETATANTMADGMAVRVPVPAALTVILQGAARIVEVTDDEVEAAMRAYFADTHQVAEGAGAAPLAALLKEGARAGAKAGVILTGGNIDRGHYLHALGDGWT
jgi:threonine dehydratase